MEANAQMRTMDPIDELPDAAPVSASDASAQVAAWKHDGVSLSGLHQIAIALDDEVKRLREDYRNTFALARVHTLGLIAENERLRVVECAARDTYIWLRRNSMHTTAHGRHLGEVLDPSYAKALLEQEDYRE
jgi:hypothetical protein